MMTINERVVTKVGEKISIDEQEYEVLAQRYVEAEKYMSDRAYANQGVIEVLIVKNKEIDELVYHFSDGRFEFAHKYTRRDGKGY